MPEREFATVPYRRPADEAVEKWTIRDFLNVTLLMALATLLRAWNIDFPSKKFFDEIYYVDAAQKLWAGGLDPNSVHPPLAKWLIGLGIWISEPIFGSNITEEFGWRLGSLIAGVLMVGATYGLSLTLFNYNRLAASFAGLFIATEHLHITMSRVTMLDPYLALFCLLGAWSSLHHFLGGHEIWAVLGAFTLGLATGCKWSGLFTAFACMVCILWLDRYAVDHSRSVRYAFWLILLLPLGFFLSYTHLFYQHGLEFETIKEIFGQGERMVKFRADEEQFTHNYISYFWQWPLVFRPIWLLYDQDNGMVHGICSVGMLFFWVGFFALLCERATAALRLNDKMAGVLVILWVCQWLPWCVSLTGGFFYYMLTEVPIMACLVGKYVSDLYAPHDALGESRWKAWLVLGLVLIPAAFYYPFAVGFEVPKWYFRLLFFNRFWV